MRALVAALPEQYPPEGGWRHRVRRFLMPHRFLTRDEARAFYNRFGSKQDQQHWYEGAPLQDLLQHGHFETARAVFELGCGTGAFAEELLAHVLPTTTRYVGVESSPTMVALTQHRLAPWADRTEVLLTDGALTFGFPDASYDCFVANYVLDLLSPQDIHQVLSEAYRLLTPAGRLGVVSLTWGHTRLARVVNWLWNSVHWLHPRLVGGCRPLQVQAFLDAERWRIDYHRVVTACGVPSEVVVASKYSDQG
jgi:ubiquinone/menaquinone biosynthesis C-methylase UbiE